MIKMFLAPIKGLELIPGLDPGPVTAMQLFEQVFVRLLRLLPLALQLLAFSYTMLLYFSS